MATDLSKTYQHKTEIEHILHRPNVYIGSIHIENEPMWIKGPDESTIQNKTIQYIPALYKLFDEGIVNCRDHVVRMQHSSLTDKKNVSYIDISVSEDGTITMVNDGDGLDVAKHPETQLWIPEMIFGHLRTSTNYNEAEEEKKMVGGQNGLGFKLVLIWSSYGLIETVDHRRGLKYTQEFVHNLGELRPPTIVKVKSTKPYTKVVFKPDYQRFGVQMTPDMVSLFHKRTIDICALTDDKLKISFNGVPIPVKNFQKYVDLYIGPKEIGKRVYETPNERWEYIVALSSTHEFQQVSFVNGICTYKGGKHVDYIMGKITRELVKFIEKKKKVRVNANSIKEQLFLFLKCDIENPSFDSQSKDCLNTTSDKFGSVCDISEGFIEKVAKMGVMDLACSITQVKEENKIAKTTDGKKGRNIHIDKYCPANFAGTSKSKDCVLILCEGDSAKSGVLSGLSKTDRDTIGIYPLRGKVLNVRGVDAQTISKNKEITELKQILGLENGREYKSMEEVHKFLNYSKIMILCDADVDGSHIKGLLINLFDCQWSSLLQLCGFISYMNTPILRATKATKQILFYNEGEYQTWKHTNPQGYTLKYFKGLGTSTSKEFKEYFANRKMVDFDCSEESKSVIDMAFNKDRADDRKQWLEKYDKNLYLNTNTQTIKYEEFINKELIHFSIYNCERSIPNVMDGLKTSQRKILYSAFKRNLVHEIKVAQFSGYVSEHSLYHHGEASLQGAIINMAQNYVGSNNINLLEPNGQFGTRCDNGADHASPRYIFTQLNPLTRLIYPKVDDSILNYLEDDGEKIEPEYYVPILPMILVNGSEGIGMGYSSEIPAYDPKLIIRSLRGYLTGDTSSQVPLQPFYEGFQGKIETMEDEGKFLVRGIYTKLSENTVRITELPVGMSTTKMIDTLKTLSDTTLKDKSGKSIVAVVKDYKENNTDTQVDIVVEFIGGKIAELEETRDKNGINGIEKCLKLTKTISTSNMYLFDAQCKLKKYSKVEEMIEEYVRVRLDTYQTRKNHLIVELEKEVLLLSNRARYIVENLEGTIDLRHKTKEDINTMLETRRFHKIDNDFEYLIKMRMDSVSKENVERLLREKEITDEKLSILKNKTIQNLWSEELTELETEYDTYKRAREVIQIGEPKKIIKTVKKKATTVVNPPLK
jgi:DNA topoisomerase-2